MTQRELAAFCRQLSRIAGAGMSFDEGILLLKEEAKSSSEQKIRMARRLQSGESLIEVLRKERLFEDEILEMIEVGLDTGNLEDVFGELADYYDREVTMKENMKTAFYYPLILGSMLLVVMSILIIKVLPIFKQVFEGMGVTSNGLTKWIFDMGGILGILVIVVLAIVWIIIFCGNFCIRLQSMQKFWKRMTQNSKYLELMDLMHITSILSLLIRNGSDLEVALVKGENIAHQISVKKKLSMCKEELEKSADLMEALNKSELFNPFIRKSLVLALRTGNLEESFKEASVYYESTLEKLMMKKLTIIEPVSVGLISVMIGSVLLAVMFPLMNLMNTLS